jgi:hypothetical protein
MDTERKLTAILLAQQNIINVYKQNEKGGYVKNTLSKMIRGGKNDHLSSPASVSFPLLMDAIKEERNIDDDRSDLYPLCLKIARRYNKSYKVYIEPVRLACALYDTTSYPLLYYDRMPTPRVPDFDHGNRGEHPHNREYNPHVCPNRYEEYEDLYNES